MKSWSAVLLLGLVACGASSSEGAGIELAGTWRVRLDPGDGGIAGAWFAKPMEGSRVAQLPGTLAQAGIGPRFDPGSGRYLGGERPWLGWPSAGYSEQTRADELGALVPERLYVGAAWYERSLRLPPALIGRRLRWELERVKGTSRLWIDGVEVPGEGRRCLYTPHTYEFVLGGPGPHRLTLRLDNRPPVDLGLAGHGYGMETEPIWNGVAGSMRLRALDPVRVRRVRIHPAGDRRSVEVRLELAATGGRLPEGSITLEVRRDKGGPALGRTTLDLARTLQGRIALASAAGAWDEFDRPLYQLTWTLRHGAGVRSTGKRRFAFRNLESHGTQLRLNGVPLFLRGNLDCAIHPDSETPPTDRAWWQRVLGIHKKAGFNHIRFHTWCPPEVAFEVADELGLYFQVETTFWVDNWIHDREPFPPRIGEDATVDAWVLAEARRMLDAYAHHPSFAFLCLGNEFGMGSDWKAIDRIVSELRQVTDTVLVSGTTARRTGAHDQYWVTHATPGGATRGTGPAHTDWDFSAALNKVSVPIISHETGQRQSWPDYDSLLPAFGPVIRPYNLLRLRHRAEQAGIHDHRARSRASVRFAYRLYKAEHEAMRRTRGLGGYQLLMLHDFTGQGEAHVGLLDPFYRAKPGIRLADIRTWNGPTVPLARFASRTWTTDQTFVARLELAHQGPGTLVVDRPRWSLHDRTHGRLVATGDLDPIRAKPGSLIALGEIAVPLRAVTIPAQLELTVRTGRHHNSWHLWVYAPQAQETPPRSRSAPWPRIAHRLDAQTLSALAAGEDVLLLFHKAIGPRLQQTRWRGTYWTGAWGWGQGLGLMCAPGHPAFVGFPNDGASDWQWRELAAGGTCVTLAPDRAQESVIVEHLSTFHRPARQAFVLEARVGPGRLLACGFDLEHNLARRPAARTFRTSLLHYLRSGAFHPALQLSANEALSMFTFLTPLSATAQASSQAPGYEAAKAIDGDPSTIWHTRWGAGQPSHPHELIVDLQRSRPLEGLWLKGRADGNNGRLTEVSIYLSDQNGPWGPAVLPHAVLTDSADWQRLCFPRHKARFVRLLTHRAAEGRPFASLAELLPIPASH